jgi:predicted acylesterase/phospholipase RssA
VIAVDLNASAVTLKRFVRPKTREVVMIDKPTPADENSIIPAAVQNFIRDTQSYLEQEINMARARMLSKPQLFETAGATMDIVQAHLAAARAQIDVADLRLTPNLEDISPAAFDRWEEIEDRGYEEAMRHKEQLLLVAGLREPRCHRPQSPDMARAEGGDLRDAAGAGEEVVTATVVPAKKQ